MTLWRARDTSTLEFDRAIRMREDVLSRPGRCFYEIEKYPIRRRRQLINCTKYIHCYFCNLGLLHPICRVLVILGLFFKDVVNTVTHRWISFVVNVLIE